MGGWVGGGSGGPGGGGEVPRLGGELDQGPHMRRRIHACHMRRRIHACHRRRVGPGSYRFSDSTDREHILV